MNRRDFSTLLAGAGLSLGWAGAALAQGGPVEGQHYVRLGKPAPVSLPSPEKKVEVVEFFWYACPACNAFEPMLDAWVRTLPPDVSFRRVPVGFAVPHQMMQKLYYTLERMGQLDAMHKRVFAAIHVQKQRLMTEKDIIAFAVASGLNEAEFTGHFRSMAVDSKARQARLLTEAYSPDGVPSIGVQGRFYTSGTLAGNFDRMIAVTDFLIQRARQSA